MLISIVCGVYRHALQFHKAEKIREYLLFNVIAKTYIHISFLFLSFCLCIHALYAHPGDSLVRHFLLQAEIRPRLEYRYNYILPPADTISPDTYITQRNRVSMLYARKKWILKADIQEIHVWNEGGEISKAGSVNFYQLYLESRFRSVNFRIGRQGVLLDNGRIFSDAPWAQQGRSHEGIRVMKDSKRISTALFFLFTRKYTDYFESLYSPVGSHRYKYLFMYYLNYKSGRHFSFNTIHSVDVFEDVKSTHTYSRANIGGRIELTYNKWYYTLNGYLQFGQYPFGKKLFAYYIQPEIKLTLKKAILRFGIEVLSGTSDSQQSAGHSGNFDVLYGVTWKFNGNLNMFTRFPADAGGKGLVNPYFFVTVPVNKKLSIRSDVHVFFTQYPLLNESRQAVNRYLGFENDLSLKYFPVKNVEINYGFSLFTYAAAMNYLPKTQDVTKPAVWSYLMVAYTFNIVDSKMYKK